MPELSTMTLWLIAGVSLLLLEALGIPGAGLLFAGLGALATGVVISLGMVAEGDTLTQFIIFFAATGIWTAILWKPLQRFRSNQKEKRFNNIVGDTAIVGAAGLGAEGGQVKWSGTTMNAQLAEGISASLNAGTKVVIQDVQGTTLIVMPK